MHVTAEETAFAVFGNHLRALDTLPRRRGGSASKRRTNTPSVGKATDPANMGIRRRWLSFYVKYLSIRVCILLAVSALVPALAQQPRKAQAQSDQDALVAFLQQSAPELVSHYFDLPRTPIFVIRRIIDLGDPRVVPALAEAFDRETEPLPREFLAAALVRLGDTDHLFFEYVAAAAVDAAKSDIPYPYDLAATAATDKRDTIDLRGQHEIQVWAQAHNVPVLDVIWRATIEVPAAVEALALTRDRRAVPILLQALQSSNPVVVREAALGLARMHEATAIVPIKIAGQHLDPEDRKWLAKSLLYFHSRRTQKAAGSMIGDSTRLQLWRAEIDRDEAEQAAVADLSRAVQGLDHAAIDLDQVDEAVREGKFASAEQSLNSYAREFGHSRKSLTRLPPGGTVDGLAMAVLDRLEVQRSKLRQTLGYRPCFGGRTAKKVEDQVEETYRMMDKLIAQKTGDVTSP